MKIRDKHDFDAKPKPISFYQTDKVSKALEAMCKHNIGSIVVIHKDDTVAGIVTERDMMIRMLGEKRDPKKTLLKDIMTGNVRTANQDDDLLDWMEVMSQERFRHLPVVDSDGKLVNLMSQGDFVAYTWPDLYQKVKQDLKGRLGKWLQLLLLLFALVTLILISHGTLGS